MTDPMSISMKNYENENGNESRDLSSPILVMDSCIRNYIPTSIDKLILDLLNQKNLNLKLTKKKYENRECDSVSLFVLPFFLNCGERYLHYTLKTTTIYQL